jgi:hypothetical protein
MFPHRREVAHLVDRHRHDFPAPARDGIGLRAAQPFVGGLQAERRIQIGAHEVVLDLGRLVERMQQRFARRVLELGCGARAGSRNLDGSLGFHGRMVIQGRRGGTLRGASEARIEASHP